MRGKAALGFVADRCRTLVSMATDSFHRVIMGKTVSPLFLGSFACMKFSHIPTAERVKKIPIGLQWEKRCLHLFLAIYDPIPMKLAGNEDMHKSLDDFEFGQDLTTDYRVSRH